MRTLACAVAAAALLLAAPVALAHQGNPNYRSVVKRSRPQTQGVDVAILNFDDACSAQHERQGRRRSSTTSSSRTSQLLADGTVQVNTNSEAYYLNEDRLGETRGAEGPRLRAEVEGALQERRASSGTTIACTGWATATRRSLKDKGEETKIDDWTDPDPGRGHRGRRSPAR